MEDRFMYNDEEGIWLGRLKSKRRKKRLQKLDRDRQLRRMDAELRKLYEQETELGYIELDKPIPWGWRRSYVLREDVARSNDAAFYQKILDRINSTELCRRKDFMQRCRKTKKLKPIMQHTLWLSQEQFTKLGFTDKERMLFEYKWVRYPNGYKYRVYVYLNEWQFEFKVHKHFITHKKVHNNILQQRISELEKVVQRYDIRCKLMSIYGHSRMSEHNYKYEVMEKDLDRSLKDYLLNRHSEMS